MTYQARSKSRPVYATAGVIVVHAGLAYAMLFGFSVPDFVPTVLPPMDPVWYQPRPEDLPKPPEAKKIEEARSRAVVDDIYLPPKPFFDDVGPKVDSDPIPGFATDSLVLGGVIDDIGGFESNPLVPKSPRPANDVARWVTTDEYPRISIIREEHGVAGFRLNVDASGRVQDCTITASSGSKALDEATCRWVTKRAKFEPATNQYGKYVAGTYSNSVKWKLP